MGRGGEGEEEEGDSTLKKKRNNEERQMGEAMILHYFVLTANSPPTLQLYLKLSRNDFPQK